MAPQVILVDAAYVDRVIDNFRQHFGAELHRVIAKADLAQWLVCVALDSEFQGDTQVVMIHDREDKVMPNFAPGNFSQEIDGKAFAEEGIGEFMLACCPVERVTTTTDLCAESLESLLDDKEVERVAVVYDFDGQTAESRTLTKRITTLCKKHQTAEKPKDITLFAMVPLEGEGFAQQVLGYSLLAALGISGDELQ